MKKLKLISSLSALSTVVAATPIIATSCTSEDSKINSITLDRNYVQAGSKVVVKVYAKCQDNIANIASVSATPKDPTKLSVIKTSLNTFTVQGLEAGDNIGIDVKVTDTSNRI